MRYCILAILKYSNNRGEGMKSPKSVFALLSAVLPLMASCGTNMQNWPYIEFGVESSDINRIYIDYFNRKDDSKSRRYFTDDNLAIGEIFDLLENTHINPKRKTKDLRDYRSKVSVYFLSLEYVFDFKAYIFGLTTYFVYNDEIREFPADFETVFLLKLDSLSANLVKIN